MAIQLSLTVRGARLDAIENTLGASPTLEIITGSPPANCASSDPGTVLVSITLPSNWMADASNGSKLISGTWQGTAIAEGTAGHFRLKVSTTCHIQGTVTVTGGGGDMTLDNTSINIGQTVSITGFTLTESNA